MPRQGRFAATGTTAPPPWRQPLKKRKKSKWARPAERQRPRPRPAQTPSNGLLHVPEAAERPWAMLPLVLALAFVARAAIALSGDFVLHP